MSALAAYLERDHSRLDELLRVSLTDPAAYQEFRKGLLRHIAIEEKVLFPLLKESEENREIVSTLRLHHGALGALLMPRLTTEIMSALTDILRVHNAIEEGEDGVYSRIEQRVPGTELLERAMAVAEVPLSRSMDLLTDLTPVKRAVERAGFDPVDYFA